MKIITIKEMNRGFLCTLVDDAPKAPPTAEPGNTCRYPAPPQPQPYYGDSAAFAQPEYHAFSTAAEAAVFINEVFPVRGQDDTKGEI